MGARVDLRSDTVTKPSEAMRRAMAAAEVGDDWYGDDPTVNRLQERAAEVTGKEAALYVATGTMANQIALHVFVRSGNVVVCEAGSHISTVELTSSAVISGISYAPQHTAAGRMSGGIVAEALRPDPHGVLKVDLVAIENTNNHAGGIVMGVEEAREIREAARAGGVPVYLDGARIFNASVASGTSVDRYGAETDALMFSVSKGLGAPIGSVLCGSRAFIQEARRVKILLGGAWRQAGIMAAAGLVALDEGPERLHEDHANATRLAEGLENSVPGTVDSAKVETNIVYADAAPSRLPPLEFLSRLEHRAVFGNVIDGRIRLVTHRDVSAQDIDHAIEAWRGIAREAGA